jgi:hypothetical protein
MITTDDELSISILKSIAQARLGPAAGELPPDLHLGSALATAFGSPEPASASEGDLARAALDLLRQETTFAQDIQLATIEASAPSIRDRYFDPVTISTLAAAMLVLQTRVKFKLDSSGNWSVEVDKKSAGDGTVKLLVQRLLAFLGK